VAHESQRFALASCLGASWIFGGYLGTLKALSAVVIEGGWVLMGEPFWRIEPAADYLRDANLERDTFGSHTSNVTAGTHLGLFIAYEAVSTEEDWDRYENLQWDAAQQYARENPDDPDVPELLDRVGKHRAAFLRWGRDTLGWAVYLFRHGPLGETPRAESPP